MLFTVILGPSFQEALRQIDKAHDADGVEIRLDCLEELDFDQINKLRHTTTKSVLFTLRRQEEGGKFEGSEKERLEWLRRLCELRPDFVDIEASVDGSFFLTIPQGVKIICSHHDFDSIPASLEDLLEKMKRPGVYAYKLAVTPKSTIDALNCFRFAKEQNAKGVRISCISMGKWGHAVRILGPLMGNWMDYASVDNSSKIVPYQLSLQEYLQTYNYRHLNLKTSIYALIGDPIDFSLSHLSHNSCIKQNALDAVYVKFPLKEHELTDFFQLARKISINGLSVTMPLKEKVFSFLDHLSEGAQKCGSVNTIALKDGKWCGDNFDGKGAVDALEIMTSLKSARLFVLGAGGAARAIVFEAKEEGLRF